MQVRGGGSGDDVDLEHLGCLISLLGAGCILGGLQVWDVQIRGWEGTPMWALTFWVLVGLVN